MTSCQKEPSAKFSASKLSANVNETIIHEGEIIDNKLVCSKATNGGIDRINWRLIRIGLPS